jgi:hypothetical protein
VPLLAVVDEGGLEAGLDPGDDSFIDVALALFLEADSISRSTALPVDDRDPQLFLLGGVEQHALHLLFSCARRSPVPSVRALLIGEASKEGKEAAHQAAARALVVSLLPVSEMPVSGPAAPDGGGLQVGPLSRFPVPRNSKQLPDSTGK